MSIVSLDLVEIDGPVSPAISWSRGVSVKSNHVTPHESPDFAGFLAAIDSDRAPGKGPQYLCGPMRGTTRSADSAEPCAYLALDMDGCAPETFALLPSLLAEEGIAALIHTTASHDPAQPRCRVFLALDRPAPRTERIAASVAMRSRIDDAIARLDGIPVRWDAACDRPEQPIYLPPIGASFDQIEGRPACLAELLTDTAAQLALTPPAAANAAPDPTSAIAGFGPETVTDLRSALNSIRSDDRDVWIRMGCALRELGDVGRGLWTDWSMKSAKWRPEDAQRWETFAHDRTGFRAVFGEAQRCGWVNPRSATAHTRGAPQPTNGKHHSGRTFGLRPIGELISSPAPLDWIVHGVGLSNSVALINGASGAGKSFLAVSLACAISTGTNWFEREVRGGPVIYLAGEGQSGIARRALAWSSDHGIPIANAPLFVSSSAALLNVEPEAAAVAEEVDGIASGLGLAPVCIVIDTLNRSFAGDENSTADMTAFVRGVDRYLRERYKCLVVVVHHTGLNPEASGRGRGSSALRAAVDSEFLVDSRGEQIIFRATKAKEWQIGEPSHFKLKTVELPAAWQGSSAVLVSADGAAQSRPMSGRQGQAIDLLRALPGSASGVSESDFAAALVSSGIATDRRRRHELLGQLEARGAVVRSSGLIRTTTDVNFAPEFFTPPSVRASEMRPN